MIEPPANFPVTWDDPEDAKLFWPQERVHAPEPVSALEYHGIHACLMGVAVWARATDYPLLFRVRRINTYVYLISDLLSLPPAELDDRLRRYQPKLDAAMDRLADSWNNEYLPEIRRSIAAWDAFDRRRAPMPDLLVHLDEVLAGVDRLWEIHFHVVVPAYTAVSMFDDFYRDLFGAESAFDGYRLLQGIDNKTVAMGRDLWKLSRKALAAPELQRLLETTPAGDVPAALERSAEGRAFLSDFRTFLEEYGHRGDKAFVVSRVPTWIEDPTPAIKNLKDYAARPDYDPAREVAALAEERERLIAEARARLKGYPQPVVDQFERRLKAAQEGMILTEDHGFWIDYRSMSRVRWMLVEFGRRFAEAGAIEAPEDVWQLTMDELRETARALPRLDRRTLVAERKAELAHFAAITPPPALGTEPAGPPPENDFFRAWMKFFGEPPPASSEPDLFRGLAGSPGTARGPARVVRTINEAGKLKEGDVLVAETTGPPWTPLFATAAAVVTDAGGILSHCAVVAREYRIPAVVGCGNASATIRDGQILEVDGSAGVVRIVT